VNIRALVAEAVGTFILVGLGSITVASIFLLGQVSGAVVVLIVPFGFGIGLLAAIAIAGHVSGGHFNPAVTLAAVLDGRLDWVSGIGYAVAQVIGAVAASLLTLVVSSMQVVSATVNQPGGADPGTLTQDLHGFTTEAVLTAIFVAVILTSTRKAPSTAGIIIPLTLIGIHFAAVPLSGASVNPARSLAPAVVSGTYDSLWVYLTAPFVGSILGWAVYKFLTPDQDDDEQELEVDMEFDELDDEDLD